MNIASAIRNTVSNTKRTIVASAAVAAVALVAPFAMGGGANAQGLAGRTTFSNQVTVTALCSQGGVTLLGMGTGDFVTGNIEMMSSNGSFYGGVWVPGVGGAWTTGPKTPYKFTATGTQPFMACVTAPGMRMQVTYTVSRAPFWQSIMAANSGTYATVQ